MTAKNRERSEREPIHSQKRLAANKRPGYVRRYVNDVGQRIESFKRAGYSIVSEDQDNSDKRASDPSLQGTSLTRVSVGGGIYAVLMEIPEEFYKEDQLAKQRQVDKIEDAIDPTKQHTSASYGQVFRKERGPIDD